jgi:hypothetical protein
VIWDNSAVLAHEHNFLLEVFGKKYNNKSMTEKKNQHYIPKFYLRNFSYLNDKKQIGIFNINNQFFYQTSKLKTQGSKNFFYGNDGVIEESLTNFEGLFSQTINQIIMTREIPKFNSKEHIEMCHFITLTDLRNPIKVEGIKVI